MVETSRAVRLSWFGGPDALMIDPTAIPQPVDDEVLVRVAAASVNPVDVKLSAGMLKFAVLDEYAISWFPFRGMGLVIFEGSRSRLGMIVRVW